MRTAGSGRATACIPADRAGILDSSATRDLRHSTKAFPEAVETTTLAFRCSLILAISTASPCTQKRDWYV
ncbi:hypothetical protein KCP74_25305 [Salmonella enterica subsp. enterica]|nr:hypothetical protein KCP74_25305 [Salmonella enterica subsp. enterica]